MVMNGINAPKVVICMGSDGHKYRQLAKSGNDDLRQDAVMEQFFGLVNTFLQNYRDTRRRIGIRTYKVVPFTPSAGVLEWVDGTIPLGEYLLGSLKNGGAHVCYGVGDWSFLRRREHMAKSLHLGHNLNYIRWNLDQLNQRYKNGISHSRMRLLYLLAHLQSMVQDEAVYHEKKKKQMLLWVLLPWFISGLNKKPRRKCDAADVLKPTREDEAAVEFEF